MSDQVEAFKTRKQDSRYVCVYLDATYIALKRDTVSKEAVYIAVGIREDGSKEVLTYTIAPTESAKVTKSLLDNPYIFTFYSFPKSIWRSIYSTNLIESFNKQITNYSKRKEQFPNEESLEIFLVSSLIFTIKSFLLDVI